MTDEPTDQDETEIIHNPDWDDISDEELEKDYQEALKKLAKERHIKPEPIDPEIVDYYRDIADRKS